MQQEWNMFCLVHVSNDLVGPPVEKDPGASMAFHGHGPGVIGDSMARQLFQRFVSYFRTPEGPVVDGYFNGNASYVVNKKDFR